MTRQRSTAAAIGVLCALLAPGAAARAQARFELVAREPLAGAPGFEVVSVRDAALGSCYTLFLFRPRSAAPAPRPADAPTVEEAAAERDRRLDALSADLQRQGAAQQRVTVPNPLQHQFDGQKALADFEQVARDAIAARIDARLAAVAAAPQLAVAGPSRCPSVRPAAEASTPEGQR